MSSPWHLNDQEKARVLRSFIDWEVRYEGSSFESAQASSQHLLDADGNGVVFRSSGSTGAPVRHRHLLKDLWEEAKCFASRLPGITRVVSLVPAHHIYGFIWTVLLPKALQVSALDGSAFRTGDLVVGTPVHWRVQNRTAASLPPIIAVTSAGPCEPALLRTLREKGALATWEIYGCSEAGGIGMRTEPDLPYQLLPFLERSGDSLVRAGIPFSPPDILIWDSERSFRPMGRIDNAVQVSGVNVYPALVARKLQRHPDVTACHIRLMEPASGGRLKAFVVADPAIEPKLRAWIEEHLTPAERPRELTFGPELPTNELGKTVDW